MNARELLQDTLADLVWIAWAYSDSKSMIDNSSAAYEMACTARARREIIESYLAAPSESAMEMVRQIRDLESHGGGDYEYYLDATEAAAKIEGLQRRVPRKMLEDLLDMCFDLGDGYFLKGGKEYAEQAVARILAKHGVEPF